MNNTVIINEKEIYKAINCHNETYASDANFRFRVRDMLDKANKLEGLTLEEAAILLSVKDQDLQKEIFDTAKEIKNDIYGSRIVLFAPLYISNYCSNNCSFVPLLPLFHCYCFGLGLIYRCYFAFFSKNILLTHKTEISKSQVNT